MACTRHGSERTGLQVVAANSMIFDFADIEATVRPNLHAKGLTDVAGRPIPGGRIDAPIGRLIRTRRRNSYNNERYKAQGDGRSVKQ